MIRQLLALPIVFVMSGVVQFISWIGSKANPSPYMRSIFDWLIGFDNAEKIRNDHADALTHAYAKRDLKPQGSKQAYAKSARIGHRKSLTQLSRGESFLSLAIAIIAISFDELPPPLPPLKLVLLGLTILVITSVFFRETVIFAFAFHYPSVFESFPQLMLKDNWNKGTLTNSRIEVEMLWLEILRQYNQQYYDLYIDFLIEYVGNEDLSRIGALRHIYQKYI